MLFRIFSACGKNKNGRPEGRPREYQELYGFFGVVAGRGADGTVDLAAGLAAGAAVGASAL